MPITVELQDMHSYSPVLFIIIFCIIGATILAIVTYIIVRKIRNKSEDKPKRIINKAFIKHRYMSMINDIEFKYRNKSISNRYAYEELSRIVRSFVFEVTGVKTPNYTLDEISKINMPTLYNMIDECYVPEFSVNSDGNILDSVNKARKVIEEWN
jgi:hypothetical protein